jgi:nicotinate-nucleotide pyrophosphorylase (carboxylating)
MFTFEEAAACRRLVEWALAEDLGKEGDLTSQAVIPIDLQGSAYLVARSPGVLAGLPAVEMVLTGVDGKLRLQSHHKDGNRLAAGDNIATILGPMRSLLEAERTALNFLQRLSGIATLTRRYVDAVAGLPCSILDTRKTTPGWRLLEKYAVRCGGGHNHRMGLFDGVLIKDNHLAALGGAGVPPPDYSSAIPAAVRLARERYGTRVPLEIEVDNLAQFDLALRAQPDIVLLDNMGLADLREAVRRRNAAAPGVRLEASGGITLAGLRDIAETGVDRISVGALTHSAPALDLGLDYWT